MGKRKDRNRIAFTAGNISNAFSSNLSLKLMAMILDMSVPYVVIVMGVFAKAPNPRKACNNLSAEEDAPADKGS